MYHSYQMLPHPSIIAQRDMHKNCYDQTQMISDQFWEPQNWVLNRSNFRMTQIVILPHRLSVILLQSCIV